MLSLIEFFYNNFIILSIIAGSLIVFLVLMRVFLKERAFNKKLKFKQGILRNYDAFKQKYPSIFKFSRVFIPLLIPIVFILAFVRSPIQYQDHIGMIQSQSDIEQIYNDFHSKFYTMSIRPQSSTDIHETLFNSYNQSVKVLGDLDYIDKHGDYLFVASNEQINVAYLSDDGWQHKHMIDYESKGLEVITLFVDSGRLFVVLEEYFDEDRAEDRDYLKSYIPKTHVYIYDIEAEFEALDHFGFKGKPTMVSLKNHQLVIVNEQYLPFKLEGFDLDDYMPKSEHNGIKSVQAYDRIRYIEGTNPDSFLNIIAIDTKNNSYTMETTLLNADYQVDMNDDDIYLISLSHEFKTASDYVEMSNPIEAYKTAITKFNVNNNGVQFFRTRLFMGEPKTNAIFTDGFLISVFLKTEQGVYLYRFNDQLGILEASRQSSIENIRGFYHDKDILYIKTKDHYTRLYDVSNPNQITAYSPSYVLNLPQNIVYSDQELLLDMNLEDNQIYISRYHSDDQLWLKQSNYIEKITHQSSALKESFNIKDIHYISENVLLLPYINSSDNDVSEFLTYVGFYSVESQTFERLDRINLPSSLHHVTPFVLRVIEEDDVLHLVTPGGIISLDKEDFHEEIDRLIFP